MALLCFFVILERLGFKNIMQFPRCALQQTQNFILFWKRSLFMQKPSCFSCKTITCCFCYFQSLIASVHIELTICTISSFQEERHTGLKWVNKGRIQIYVQFIPLNQMLYRPFYCIQWKRPDWIKQLNFHNINYQRKAFYRGLISIKEIVHPIMIKKILHLCCFNPNCISFFLFLWSIKEDNMKTKQLWTPLTFNVCTKIPWNMFQNIFFCVL